MHKLYKTLLLGLAAGILDVIPMAFLNLNLTTLLATLLHWLGLSIIITYARMPLNNWGSGMLIAGLTSLPLGVVIHTDSIGGICQMTFFGLVLGGLLGYTSDRLINKQP